MGPFVQISAVRVVPARLKRVARRFTHHQYYRKRLVFSLALTTCLILVLHSDYQSNDTGDDSWTEHHHRQHHHHHHHHQHYPPRHVSSGDIDRDLLTQVETEQQRDLDIQSLQKTVTGEKNNLRETIIRTGSKDMLFRLPLAQNPGPENGVHRDGVHVRSFPGRPADDMTSSHTSMVTEDNGESEDSKDANLQQMQLQITAKGKSEVAGTEHRASGQLLLHSSPDEENFRHQGMPTLQKPERRRRRKCMNDGIYWSSSTKELLPKGLPPAEADAWLEVIRQHQVASLRRPEWNRCGRPQNAIAVIDKGPTVCARYRAPHNRLVFGEVMSYWLSRFLGLDNVPPVILSMVNSSQWSNVAPVMRELDWEKDQYTALIMWIDNIGRNDRSRTFMPQAILRAIESGQPWMPYRNKQRKGCLHLQPESQREDTNNRYFDSARSRGQMPSRDLTQLAQWGNMIIFDYITGNYDRVASMLDGADKQRRPETLREQIRNLPTSSSSGQLWLIDNESGLFDAYDLLYVDRTNGRRFHQFHTSLLQSLCTFDKTLIDNVRILADQSLPHHFLKTFAMKHDRLVREFPIGDPYHLFQMFFHSRLKEVLDWVQRCEKLYYGID